MNLPSRASFSVFTGAISLLLGISSAFAQTEAPAATTAPATEPAPAAAPAPEAAVAPAETAAPTPAPVEAALPEPAPVAEPAPAPEVPAEPPVEAPKPPPPPYSLPFQLRPVVVGNVVRSDTAFAFYKSPANKSGSTIASMLLASYKVTEDFAPMIRLGVVSNSPPDGATAPTNMAVKLGSGASFLNPVIGATYALKLGKEWKLAPFLGVALPLGGGSGNSPDPDTGAALRAGIPARSAMDNAMFATNDLVIFPGVGFAYVSNGFTAQVEATLLQLTRVKGDKVQPDASRTNFTTGVHAGYFFAPIFSFGAELRHQRWLSTPTPVKADNKLRDTTTVAFGPRFHFKLGEKMWLRPAVALALPLDDPMSASKQKIVQLDIPFVF